jgi:hypothetical protein
VIVVVDDNASASGYKQFLSLSLYSSSITLNFTLPIPVFCSMN